MEPEKRLTAQPLIFPADLAWWPEADNDKQAFNISIMNFGAAKPTIGMGPVTDGAA